MTNDEFELLVFCLVGGIDLLVYLENNKGLGIALRDSALFISNNESIKPETIEGFA